MIRGLKLVDQGRIRLGQFASWGVTPQAVEIVELAHRFVEDVNDDIGKIHQYPMTATRAFHRKRRETRLAEIFVDSLRNALHLSIGTP